MHNTENQKITSLKGEIIVLQSAEDSKEMCLRHLNDSNYHEIIPEVPSQLILNELKQ